MYEDYRFLTEQEVRSLGVDNLIGTPLLRGYMHGYFVDTKLYNKLRAVADLDSYEDYKKQRLREKVEAKRKSRISVQKKLPKINAAPRRPSARRRRADGAESNPTGDDRFGALFSDSRFQVDEQSEEFRLQPPAPPASCAARRRRSSQKTRRSRSSTRWTSPTTRSRTRRVPGRRTATWTATGRATATRATVTATAMGAEARARRRAAPGRRSRRLQRARSSRCKRSRRERGGLFGTAQTSRKEQAKATQQRKTRKVPIRERMRREAAERARAKQRVGTERDLETGRTVRTLTFTPKSNRPNRKG